MEKLNQAKGHIDKGLALIEACEEAESDAMDNIPENLQSGRLYESMEDNVSRLQDIIGKLEECQDLLEEF